MTDYSIKLPESKNVHKPNIIEGGQSFILNRSSEAKSVLKIFDTDDNGVTADELMQAFDYFVQKEKEIAVTGKKGDGIITSKDIEQIIKTDSKFDKLRKKYNNDSKVVDLLSRIVITLCGLVSLNAKHAVFSIMPGVFETIIPEDNRPEIFMHHYTNYTRNGKKPEGFRYVH